MKITLSEWMQLHVKFSDLNKAIAAVEQQLAMLMIAHKKDAGERALLAAMHIDVNKAMALIHKYDTLPQSEWMGGPTEGPGSEHTKTYLREPHCVGLPQRHFSAEEVAEAKKLGLITGGTDLTGPKSS